jgi:hypothetical protein
MAARKLSMKKFNGDDRYSWAVFYADDVRGIPSPVMLGDARPIVSGLDRREASYHKRQIEARRA